MNRIRYRNNKTILKTFFIEAEDPLFWSFRSTEKCPYNQLNNKILKNQWEFKNVIQLLNLTRS
jgi:hypothetical protein